MPTVQQHATGTAVRIDQGFGRYTEGRIQAFGRYTRPDGYTGFGYTVLATGGVDCFGKPAAGLVHYVNPAHVTAA